MVSSVTSTCAIRLSTLTAVLMPSLDNGRFIFNDETTDLVEFSGTEPMIPRQCYGRQPELRVLPGPTNVDVHRFGALKTVEKEPVWPWNA